MLWFYAAFTAAVAFGLNVLIANHIMEEASSFDFAAIFSVLGALFYLPIFLYFLPRTSIGGAPLAWLALVVSGLANTGGMLTSSRAVKDGEVSTVTPLIRTQPAFAALLGFAVLGEVLDIQKIIGIGAVTLGGYVVLLRAREPLLEPVEKLRTSFPAQLGVLSGFLFAVGAVSDRYALASIPAELYTFFLLAFMAVSFLTYISVRKREKFGTIKNSFSRHTPFYVLVGISTVVAYYSTVTALSLAEASRVVPILQFQVLVAVAGGYLLFDETAVGRKLGGSVLLILGVVLIAAQNLLPV
ncbi:MAG: EamA family transporter [Candidatus Nanohaloarchaea archaeon]